MYYTIPRAGKTDKIYEHIVDARRAAIRYIKTHPGERVYIYEKRRGEQGVVFKAKDRLTGKRGWGYRTNEGIDHFLNLDGSIKRV